MKINEQWEIRPDKYGWVLVEHLPTNPNHHKSTGKGSREIHRYYPSVQQCCVAIMQETGKGVDTARELMEHWEKVKDEILSCEALK